MIAGAGLVTWSIAGGDLQRIAEALEGAPEIRTVAPFGNTLHISADSVEALEHALAPLRDAMLSVTPIEASLEDVFIALMQEADDNFAPPRAAAQ